jgi:hypothetical protein
MTWLTPNCGNTQWRVVEAADQEVLLHATSLRQRAGVLLRLRRDYTPIPSRSPEIILGRACLAIVRKRNRRHWPVNFFKNLSERYQARARGGVGWVPDGQPKFVSLSAFEKDFQRRREGFKQMLDAAESDVKDMTI